MSYLFSGAKGACIALICSGLFYFFMSGCEHNTRNFSQYPGFAEYFSANPPSHDLPSPQDRQLLRRFKPRFMIADGEAKPIDFYRDYIVSGVLNDSSGNVMSSNVTRELLNSYRNNPDIVFKHVPGQGSGDAVVYGRIDRVNISFHTDNGQVLKPLAFLTYHMVFRNSGMPAGIPAWQEVALDLFFDLDDWHQLDHYTAVSLIIQEHTGGGGSPVALMLQQHDNLRTYLIGETVMLPHDGRVLIDIAKRSNELYPHTPGPVKHRAVHMPEPEAMRFLLTGERKPLFAGYDVTDSMIEVDYTLEFLPPADAFYMFKGYLGERRRVKGRDAPPGAAYNTLPQLKPLSMQLFSGYWRENNPGDIERLERTILAKGDYTGFARMQGAEFYKNWQGLQQGR